MEIGIYSSIFLYRKLAVGFSPFFLLLRLYLRLLLALFSCLAPQQWLRKGPSEPPPDLLLLNGS